MPLFASEQVFRQENGLKSREGEQGFNSSVIFLLMELLGNQVINHLEGKFL